jgi:hypothetical protein
MATFTITAIITVEGAQSRKDAFSELQVMLDDYADNNSENGKEISIHIKKTEKKA